MKKAIISKIINSSVVDGPGNRMAIFFQGCNFNCMYCHNPETIVNASTNDTKMMSIEDILSEIKKYKSFIRGITVSGGECTLNADFITVLFKEVKKYNLSTMIDSNGSHDFSKDNELMKYTDSVMLDIKAYDREEHKKLTGKYNDMVLKNAEYLAKVGKLYEIRTVIVPEFLSNKETIKSIANLLIDYIKKNNIKYKLIKYRPIGVREEYKDFRVPNDEEMEELKMLALKNGFEEVIVI
ncbi:MAG: radical SAM protein [Senegalia sp. (in: firmicutes)]|uniref:radical SAM protein n=1 Tax=Senegalia sp. (in: firmicutes) TaxID=1924098 RepID=UPI003F98D866